MEATIKQIGELLPSGCTLVACNNEGERLGHAHLTVEQNIATLADIYVRAEVVEKLWIPLLKRKVCCRNQGIGSKLLGQVKELCQASGIKIVSGQMVGDVGRLKKWYTKHGFEVIGETIKYNC
ncbi:GNAT family N-acetyltransferase [Endozoicomonas sp. ALB032]|uniref:GNAT family N-acetyltransferase n=1 Tax=Endozoicomonas sp. ALB032 TaxID=3403082 RepID=UPI003BB5F469